MRRYLTQTEIRSVLDGLDMPYKLIAEIMVWTGRRPSEVLMMKPGDIDHENKIIEFIQLKKRKKKVTKPIDCTAFYNTLYDYLRKTPMAKYVFPSPVNEGRHLTIRILQKKVKKAGEKVGLNVHPHLFRHSFAVQYLERRINTDKIDPIQALYELKNILGHSSIDTTMGYLAYVTGKESLKGLWEM